MAKGKLKQVEKPQLLKLDLGCGKSNLGKPVKPRLYKTSHGWGGVVYVQHFFAKVEDAATQVDAWAWLMRRAEEYIDFLGRNSGVKA